MDVHLLMALCSWGMFLTLSRKYLRSVSHDMFTSIRSLLETKDVVPATVAGVSHVNKDDVNMAMCKMIELLHLA